ncbi:MAG: glutamyl-tRNA reductase [Planctomycetes bacterium]|nr:glutamyl-tRNA reductase [Planctomycetota bacterium]
MELSVVGVNHRGAPVEVREQLSFEEARLPEALAELRRATGAAEAVILSTCNRVELYTVRAEGAAGAMESSHWLALQRGVPDSAIASVLYRHAGLDVIRHLFRVAGGLDAMVLGETQIIAQVKEAYRVAKDSGHADRVFNVLFQRALRVAKQIHTTTAIGAGGASVPAVAARLAGKVFQNLAQKRVMIVGAGETGEFTLAAFHERGTLDPLVVNRTVEHAERLIARFGGRAVGLDRLAGTLPEADVVITCLGSSEFCVTPDMVETAVRARRGEPIVFIDIAVPRNVHPGVNRIENIYLFDIDDLQGIVAQNISEREHELARCEPLIDSEARRALQELGEADVHEVVGRLRDAQHAMADEELRKTWPKLGALSPDQRQEIEYLLKRVTNKILHGPTTAIKEAARDGSTPVNFLEIVTKLFRIK